MRVENTEMSGKSLYSRTNTDTATFGKSHAADCETESFEVGELRKIAA